MLYTATHPLVVQVAAQYRLRPDVLAAQIQVESGGDPFAFRYERAFFTHYIRDHASARGYSYGPLAACSFGLLQILLETALEHGFSDRPEVLFDPQTGLSWGALYVRRCLDASGDDIRKALARYNGAGQAATAYASKVLQGLDA